MEHRTPEFSAAQVTELLAELDERLRRRGTSASIYVVGGAAIAVTGVRDGRLTQDVDAMTAHPTVMEEARALAADRGLPASWLNPAASMWMPPLPAGVLDPPEQPGLRVTFADDAFLFATKLIAQRARDAGDLRALAARLGLVRPAPELLEAHIRRYYDDTDALELVLGVRDVDGEILLLAQDAARMLSIPS